MPDKRTMTGPEHACGTAEACRVLPSHGAAWEAAIDYGIDVSLIERNLRLTPTERLLQLDDMLASYAALRP